MKQAFFAAIAVLVAGLSAFAYLGSRSNRGDEAEPETRTAAADNNPSARGGRAVHALGRLEPTGTVLNIAAPAGNEGDRLSALYVREGDRVTKDTLLGTMDTYSRRLAVVEQERARISTAGARLSQVKAGNKDGDIDAARYVVSSAEHEVRVRARERERYEKLREKQTITDSDLDGYRLAHEKALAVLQQSKAQLEALSEVRAVDIAVAESELQQAQAALTVANAHLEASRILAPADGTILRIHTRPGEHVSTNGILEMGDIDHMQAVAEVFEGDLPFVAVGDTALITIDTTRHEVPGIVREVGFMVARKTTLTNDPVSDTDARVVEVRIDLENNSYDWLSRMSNARIQVHIDTGQNPNAETPIPSRDSLSRNGKSS